MWWNIFNRMPKPYSEGFLPEKDGHKIHYYQYGNPVGERYGIAPSRIEAQGIGSNAQPYEDNDLNRVVIVTALPE